MKKRNLTIFLASFLGFYACTNAPDAEKATTTDAKDVAAATGSELKVDTTASKIEWIGTKVSGYHTGSINIKSGTLRAVGDSLTGGNLVLDMKSMVISGPPDVDAASNAKLLGHLKSPDFFDVEKFPDGTFEITGIKPFTGSITDSNDVRQASISKYRVSNPTHMVSGNLTLKGVTKNIEFPAQISSTPGGIEALAKFNVDRTQWGIVYPGKPDDLIRKDIHLGISLKANK